MIASFCAAAVALKLIDGSAMVPGNGIDSVPRTRNKDFGKVQYVAILDDPPVVRKEIVGGDDIQYRWSLVPGGPRVVAIGNRCKVEFFKPAHWGVAYTLRVDVTMGDGWSAFGEGKIIAPMLSLDSIAFDHDRTDDANDAETFRESRIGEAYTVPEIALQSNRTFPALYAGAAVDKRVKLRILVRPKQVYSVGVSNVAFGVDADLMVDCCNPTVMARDGAVELGLKLKVLSGGIIKDEHVWDFEVVSVNGGKFSSDVKMANSIVGTVYALPAKPQSPWVCNGDDDRNPWRMSMAFMLDKAEKRGGDLESYLTRLVWSNKMAQGYRSESLLSMRDGGVFRLGCYYARSVQSMNCMDAALALATHMRLCGINCKVVRQNLRGKNINGWSFHCYVVSDGLAYDACHSESECAVGIPVRQYASTFIMPDASVEPSDFTIIPFEDFE